MNLIEFFKEHPRVAIAFSGGVDSTYLLYAAARYAQECMAYYVKSAFQPQFEYEDAIRFCENAKLPLRCLSVDVLAYPEVTDNPENRCYYCKQRIFTSIYEAAKEDGFTVLLDGTNASDDADSRPGMRALRELSVLSPLRICGLTKAKIRELSKEAGLPTWDKPAYACLATRIPAGEKITQEKLTATEEAESFLLGLGFTDFRVRRRKDMALLQVNREQMGKVLEHREEILERLKKYYSGVALDLTERTHAD